MKNKISSIYIVLIAICPFYLISATNSNIQCKTIHSRYRTVKLSTILPYTRIKTDEKIGFIKDDKKILTQPQIKEISQKYKLNIPFNCVEIIYKSPTHNTNNTKKEEISIALINRYLKERNNLTKATKIQLLDRFNLTDPDYKITSLRQIENDIYEIRILHNNKESKVKVRLEMVTPTLIARDYIRKNSILTRKLFTLQYKRVNKDNLTLREWQINQFPVMVKNSINRGEVIKKKDINLAPKFTKEILSSFKCHGFTITKKLKLKKINKENIVVEDTGSKKEYLAYPIGENKAIIKNVGCK